MKTKKHSINPYVLVILSFVAVILLGTGLLCLPFSHTNGQWGNFIDEIFTATSATCVTGLCTYATGIGNELTFFGQLVVLMMIQIGGLGFVTVLTFIVTLFKSKLQFKNRYLLSQMVGSTNFADVVKFVRKLILISFSCEAIGFIIGLPVFFHVYPHEPLKALWSSLFISVSAFNNAGFDIFGATSLVTGVGNPFMDALGNGWAYYYLCTLIMVLVVMGGISFLVILELFTFKKANQWRVFTKIVLSTTGVLLLGGTLVLFVSEGLINHNMNFFECLFQSVTCRTAGFATYNQDDLSVGGKVFSCLLMFIGGSPLSTAGGIKTTTIFMIVLAMFSYFRGRHVVAFKREYGTNMIVKAMSLVFTSLFFLIISFVAISSFERNTVFAINTDKATATTFELFSAMGTVGLSTGITPSLSLGSKIVICLLMLLGRLGPMTFLQLFQINMNKNDENIHYQYVEEDFLIG